MLVDLVELDEVEASEEEEEDWVDWEDCDDVAFVFEGGFESLECHRREQPQHESAHRAGTD